MFSGAHSNKSNNPNTHTHTNTTALNATLYKPTTPPSTAALTRLATKTLNRKVARGPLEQKELTPSEYLRIVGLNTMQYNEQVSEVRPARIVELVSSGDGTQQLTDIDEPLFQPYPSEVRFQAYNAFERYEVPLTFRNTDKVARRITVLPLESAFFKVRAPPNAGAKVASGIDVTYTIEFSPDDIKDYSEDLVCLTDREKFVVPLRALGARAVIDFPDSVAFGACVVKHTTTKTLLVRNIGKRKGIFSLSAAEPYSVEPRHSQLDVGQSMQVNVSFSPTKVGSSGGGLSVLYSTGEEVVVALSGGAEDANVRLEKTSLRMDSTFIGQVCQRTVRINNRR